MNDYLSMNLGIYYWSTSNGLEVDFILYGEQGIFAFEIKRSNKIRSKDLHGLKAFKKDYPETKLYMVYGGARRFHQDDINVLPFQDCLKILPEILAPK